MSKLIEANPSLLLMLQHFDIDFRVDELTVEQICEKYSIGLNLFLSVANLYNGVRPQQEIELSKTDLQQIIDFLRNSHIYYRKYKYPEISSYIHQLQEESCSKELLLVEKFFNKYFEEVLEHLDYEDNVAFPYFISLINKETITDSEYSAQEYNEHHTDIELKLADLKKLLLKHIKIKDSLNLRRQLLFALFELEFDLYIHSLIEDTILIPAGYKIENSYQ